MGVVKYENLKNLQKEIEELPFWLCFLDISRVLHFLVLKMMNGFPNCFHVLCNDPKKQ